MTRLRLRRCVIALAWLGLGMPCGHAQAPASVSPAPTEVRPPRPPPPTRAPDGPDAPQFIVVGAAAHNHTFRAAPGKNPPSDQDGDFLIGPDYIPAPELKESPDVPRGKVEQFTLSSVDSQFYPGIAREAFGTVDPNNPKTMVVQIHPEPYIRTITVYIPQQYKAGAEVPFMVSQDGPGLGKPDLGLPHVLDNLIAQRRVPPLVVVMVAHGGGDAQGSERGLEYDTVSGKYAEFIQAEVLPAVEAKYNIKLTHDPAGRAAMGSSSGGAAAFTMAWFHPEWYHRVLTYSGTYVNQQWPFDPANPGGAWEYHAKLIPQSPPKPIRLWMEVGDRDNYNSNVLRDGMHDWVIANHRMAAALKAKGYHYQYIFAVNAGHTDRNVRAQTLPEALEWLWRGYPVDRS